MGPICRDDGRRGRSVLGRRGLRLGPQRGPGTRSLARRPGRPQPTWPFGDKHVEHFASPKAYALVVDALLDKRDFIAAMALLMQWLSQADRLPLQQGEYSFHPLARRWLAEVLPWPRTSRRPAAASSWSCKFFDYLEANAEDYGQVPKLELDLAGDSQRRAAEPDEPADDDEEGDDRAVRSRLRRNGVRRQHGRRRRERHARIRRRRPQDRLRAGTRSPAVARPLGAGRHGQPAVAIGSPGVPRAGATPAPIRRCPTSCSAAGSIRPTANYTPIARSAVHDRSSSRCGPCRPAATR